MATSYIGAIMFDSVNNFDDSFERGRFANDKGVRAHFYTNPIVQEVESAEAGRRICKDVVFVEIMTAGNTNSSVVRKATDEDKGRFRRQYEAFLSGNSEQAFGTPLSDITWLTKSQVEELAYMKIRSLEELANVSDTACAGMAGLYDLKRKAGAFLERADQSAPITALAKENEVLQGQVAALQAQMQELIASVQASQRPAKK